MIRKLLHHDRLAQRMLAHRVGVFCGGQSGETFGKPQGERPRHSLSAMKPAERWA